MEKTSPHIPVLCAPMLAACAPIRGHWIDATMGAGGYTRALLEAGAEYVTAIDCDLHAHALAEKWKGGYASRISFFVGNFAEMENAVTEKVDGVVFDLGVSSMQLDTPERGFSFTLDGPLDMRMSPNAKSARELVNAETPEKLADILFQYGEERAARRIAKEIVAARPFTHTRALADCIAACLPPRRAGERHPATRSFQALRIAVNDELGALIAGLEAGERILRAGGNLAVVSFHSLEDRIVKRFLSARTVVGNKINRHAPSAQTRPMLPAFEAVTRKAIKADSDEVAANARARSARLRVARRTGAPVVERERRGLGLPGLLVEAG